MPQFRLDQKSLRSLAEAASNDQNADVRGPMNTAGRPCLVTLESGIQALVEIARFTYVDGIPLAISAGFAEDINPADFLEGGPDGIRFKSVGLAGVAGPVDVDSHWSKSFTLPHED